MKKLFALLMALALLLAASCCAEMLVELVPEPQLGSIGGEWAVIALARGDCDVPEDYFAAYLDRVEAKLAACDGVLHAYKRTEYARVSLALAALGENPADFRGYDLLTPLTEVEQVKLQGNNGPIWALIALSSGDYDGVDEAVQTLIAEVLSAQNADGGFGIASGQNSDTDMTAMALTALAPHADGDSVRNCVNSALEFLSKAKYRSCESCAQALVAYSALNMSAEAAQAREAMELYAFEGAYRHNLEETQINVMASEQAFYALAAYARMQDARCALFDMRDAK